MGDVGNGDVVRFGLKVVVGNSGVVVGVVVVLVVLQEKTQKFKKRNEVNVNKIYISFYALLSQSYVVVVVVVVVVGAGLPFLVKCGGLC